MEYMHIKEFAKYIGKHQNTVDNWFKMLEERKVHYIQRIQGQKVYDEQDMKIGQFVCHKRRERWNMDRIMEVLNDHCDVRTFPSLEVTPATPAVNAQMVLQSIDQAAQQVAAARGEFRTMYEDLVEQLQSPFNRIESRQQRVTELLTERRVITALEEEALKLWVEQPKGVRLKSAGFFRKTEDLDRRDTFVRAYVNEHFEQRLQVAYGLSDVK